MDSNFAKRLLVLALVTFTVMGSFAMLLFVGLVHFRDVFEKLLFMIGPPLIAVGGWAENRSKRKIFGLQNTKITSTRVLIALAIIVGYGLIAFTWFDRFESFFVFVPTLLALAYSFWVGIMTSREGAPGLKN